MFLVCVCPSVSLSFTRPGGGGVPGMVPPDMFKIVQLGPHCTGNYIPTPSHVQTCLLSDDVHSVFQCQRGSPDLRALSPLEYKTCQPLGGRSLQITFSSRDSRLTVGCEPVHYQLNPAH